MKLKTLGLAVSLAMGLVACNDSSSDSNNYDFKVTAIDGYLKNAVVTVQCGDQTFTPTPTGANGQTTVKTQGTPSSQCSVTITAAGDGSTVDMTTGKKFSAGNLYLKTPAGLSGDLVATPFTTLVALKLESGEASSLDDAVGQVANEYGIPEQYITSDFVASTAPEAIEVAIQAIALTPFLPSTENDFKNIAKDQVKSQALDVKLGKVVAAVKQAIDDAKNDGIDLTSINFSVNMDSSGNVTVTVEANNPPGNNDGGNNTPTGGTGGTGTGGTSIGGGTGN